MGVAKQIWPWRGGVEFMLPHPCIISGYFDRVLAFFNFWLLLENVGWVQECTGQSFVSPVPLGLGNSGAVDISILKPY